MDSIGKRLGYYIDKQEKSLRQWALENGIAYNNLTQILRDEKPLGMNVLLQIKQAIPEIDVNWLLFGEQPKNISQNENTNNAFELPQPIDDQELSDPYTKTLLYYLDRSVVREKIRDIIFGSEDLARREFEALSDKPNFTINLDELSTNNPQEFRRLLDKVDKWNKEGSKK